LWLVRIYRKVLAVKICSQEKSRFFKNRDCMESLGNDHVSELNARKYEMISDYSKYLESENRVSLFCGSHFYSDTFFQ